MYPLWVQIPPGHSERREERKEKKMREEDKRVFVKMMALVGTVICFFITYIKGGPSIMFAHLALTFTLLLFKGKEEGR